MIYIILFGASFAAHAQNRSIFIEGTAVNAAQQAFFMDNFSMEGASVGYAIVDDKDSAAYTFRFDVVPNMVEYEDGTQAQAPPDEEQFVIMISFVRNADDSELISFGFPFTELDEMYEFNQYLFLRTAFVIPNEAEAEAQSQTQALVQEDDAWRNKWLYLRASADFRVTFLVLNDANLIGGSAVYSGPRDDPHPMPIDNRISALPGATLGIELQFLDWMSIEPNFQVVLGDSDQFLFMALGAELKFPIKAVRNVILAPYGAFSYPLTISPVYFSFPLYTVGGGLQVGIKAGNIGALFVDINYMLSLHNAALYNPHVLHYPNPSIIHYRRSVLGIGLGYKFGFLNRK